MGSNPTQRTSELTLTVSELTDSPTDKSESADYISGPRVFPETLGLPGCCSEPRIGMAHGDRGNYWMVTQGCGPCDREVLAGSIPVFHPKRSKE